MSVFLQVLLAIAAVFFLGGICFFVGVAVGIAIGKKNVNQYLAQLVAAEKIKPPANVARLSPDKYQ